MRKLPPPGRTPPGEHNARGRGGAGPDRTSGQLPAENGRRTARESPDPASALKVHPSARTVRSGLSRPYPQQKTRSTREKQGNGNAVERTAGTSKGARPTVARSHINDGELRRPSAGLRGADAGNIPPFRLAGVSLRPCRRLREIAGKFTLR